MPSKKVNWWEVDKKLSGLETDVEHEINVQREAIPLIFVPGIMGSRLRRGGQPSAGNGADGLPNMRWDPSNAAFMAKNYLYRYAARRKKMIIGDRFNPGFLEVANLDPVGDGFEGIMDAYRPFLVTLRTRSWGALGKLFEFPVYAFGYNWTDSAEKAGAKLAARIPEIIAEAKDVVGACEKVILITHSMGGLVSRACSELSGARGNILGIVHGVQPVTGSGAAYWRIKAGFEGDKLPSGVLGNDGKDVTVALGNSPGGLQLLPNKHHRTNAGEVAWLRVTKDGVVYDGLALPRTDPPNPYDEIYRVKAVVEQQDSKTPSGNAYWGLVDPRLLAPGESQRESDPGSIDADSDAGQRDPWSLYLGYLAIAESFHDRLGTSAHPHSFCFTGIGHKTVDIVEMKVEWAATPVQNYRTRGFAGEFTTADGWDMKAILQDPAGAGDGTVPTYSARKLKKAGKPKPGDADINAEHQPAYEVAAAQTFTINAITALCKLRFDERRGG